MSQEARLKRLGINHLPPAERMKWLEERLAAGRQQEAEARAADQQRQAAQQQAGTAISFHNLGGPDEPTNEVVGPVGEYDTGAARGSSEPLGSQAGMGTPAEVERIDESGWGQQVRQDVTQDATSQTGGKNQRRHDQKQEANPLDRHTDGW